MNAISPIEVRHETLRIAGRKVAGDNGSFEIFHPYNGIFRLPWNIRRSM